MGDDLSKFTARAAVAHAASNDYLTTKLSQSYLLVV